MAGNVKVVLKSVWDDKGIKQATAGINGISKGIATSFKAIGIATAAASAVIGKFAIDSVKAASDLSESTNAVNVAFGAAAKGVLAIGESSAESLGLARSEFNSAAVKFSAFAERVVGSGGDVAGFIGDISTRAADFASVFNIEVADAMAVFQSGLSGEAEPLKRFGINLLDSEVKAYAMANGIGEVGKQLTETEKTQARYGLLMQETAKTQGDFANTSDGLANSQRILQSSFTDIQAELGTALLPVMSDVVNQIKDKLLPLFQQLGDWLKSPAGIKAVADLGQAFSDGIQNIIDFTGFVIDNWDAIKKVATAMVIAAGTFYAFTTAVNISTAAVKLFNTATLANPWTLAAIAVAGIATGMWLVYEAAKKTAPAVQEVNTAILESENAFVTSATNGSSAFKGLIPNLKYTGNALDKVRIASEANTAEFNRFNNLNLSNARNEMAKTANATNALGNQIAANNRQLYYAMHPELVDPSKPPATPSPIPTYSGPSQAQQVASAIKDANKAIASATKKYSGAVSSAKESYKKAVSSASDAYKKATESADIARGKALIQANTENANAIISINQNAASKLASIVAESVNRLRDAFKSAVATNVADIFATDEVGQSVDNLVTNLRDRLAASKALLAKSASLSSAGFSQTFIEQVVGAGLTAGNELANAVLEATPQTQKELQGLYAALEIESNTGMDTLSQTIYDGAGLATDALKQMYADTLTEQTQALADQAAAYATAQAEIQSQFETAMTDAAVTRDTALADAMTVYKDALIAAAKDFKDSLDEIETQFKDKIAELGKLKQSLQNDINALQGLIDQKQKLAGIAAQTGTVVNTTPKVNIKSPIVTGNTNATVINVNVKTDSTQSTAQVGKTIAKAVQKYTGTGSGLNKTFAI